MPGLCKTIFIALCFATHCFAGCNVKVVQVDVADALNSIPSAITSAFAACAKCPCQIKVSAQATVISDASSKAIDTTSKQKYAGNCGDAQASATATTDTASTLSQAISNAITKACGDNAASSQAASVVIGAFDTAGAQADAAVASGRGSAAASSSTVINNALADSLSQVVSKCKCGGGRNGSSPCPPGQAKKGSLCN